MKVDLMKYEALTNHKRIKIEEIRKYCKFLYDAGNPCEIVAGLTSFSVSAIHKIAHQDGWVLRRNMKEALAKVKAISESEVLRMRSKGKTLDQISQYYELKSRKPIRDILTRNGIPVTWSIDFDRATNTEVISLYQSGVGVRGISQKLGVDPCVVKRNLESNGIVIRSQVEQNRIIALNKFVGNRSDRTDFAFMCRTLTRYNFRYNKYLINPKNVKLGKQGFEIDHMASIYSAYQYVRRTGRLDTIYLICHPANLQLISPRENARKNTTSWLSRFELFERVQDHNFTYGCPYSRFWDLDELPIYSWFESQIGHFEGYDVK
jgi:hypothetical protein